MRGGKEKGVERGRGEKKEERRESKEGEREVGEVGAAGYKTAMRG